MEKLKSRIKESQIQKSILEYLSYCTGIYYFRAGSGAVITRSGNLFRSGKAGCPDIVVCDRGGKFIGLEVKVVYGKQSNFQRMAECDIRKAGGEYHIVHSVEEVQKIIPLTKKINNNKI